MASICAEFMDELAEAELRAGEEDGVAQPKEATPKKPSPKKVKVPPKKTSPKKILAQVLNPGAHNSPLKKRGADKLPRASRGSMQTFAGRRPPADPDKLEAYNRMRQDYEALQAEAKKSGKKVSLNQSKYYDFMKQEMKRQGGKQQGQVLELQLRHTAPKWVWRRISEALHTDSAGGFYSDI